MASVSDILLERGRSLADARRQRGQASGQMWSTLGQIGQQAAGQIQQYQQDAPRRELQTLQLNEARRGEAGAQADAETAAALRDLFAQSPNPDPKAIYAIVGPERGTKIVEGLTALQDVGMKRFKTQQEIVAATLAGMDALPETLRAELYPHVRETLVQRQIITPQDAPEAYDPKWFQQARNFGQAPPKAPGSREIKVRNPDGTETIKIVPDTPGQEFRSAPVAERVTFSAPTSGMIDGRPGFFRAGSDGKVYDLSGKVVTNVTPRNEPAAAEPLIAVMKDGKPVLVRRSQAEGMTPATSREQGRPVVSGDANRLADFDTSLDDAEVLSAVIKDPGTLSRIQAWAPNWVTEITGGWGADAKSQNAVISRVRQVIGKALEGGVLRKEDEVKYRDILPVIGDPKEVVDNKLIGLKAALAKRKARLLDALEDAGYEVSKFRERQSKIDSERNPGTNAPDFIWDAKAGKLVPNPKKGGG